jgi:hypothetical protein
VVTYCGIFITLAPGGGNWQLIYPRWFVPSLKTIFEALTFFYFIANRISFIKSSFKLQDGAHSFHSKGIYSK